MKDSVTLDQNHPPAKRLQLLQKCTGQKSLSSFKSSFDRTSSLSLQTILRSVIGQAFYDAHHSCHSNTRPTMLGRVKEDDQSRQSRGGSVQSPTTTTGSAQTRNLLVFEGKLVVVRDFVVDLDVAFRVDHNL